MSKKTRLSGLIVFASIILFFLSAGGIDELGPEATLGDWLRLAGCAVFAALLGIIGATVSSEE
jgi:hypothetical protein